MVRRAPSSTPSPSTRLCRPKLTPLNPTYVRDKDALATLSPMLDQAGEIGYLSERTRLDIAFAASMLRCEAGKPTAKTAEMAAHIWTYLKSTITFQHKMGGRDSDLTRMFGYADGSKSHIGYCLFISNDSGAFHAKSLSIKTIITSSTEAEILALFECVKAVLYYRAFLSELGHTQSGPTQLFQDNQSVIRLCEKIGNEQQTKHIINKLHFIREQIEFKSIHLTYISTDHMVADTLTKALPKIAFTKHSKTIMHGHDNLRPTGEGINDYIQDQHDTYHTTVVIPSSSPFYCSCYMIQLEDTDDSNHSSAFSEVTTTIHSSPLLPLLPPQLGAYESAYLRGINQYEKITNLIHCLTNISLSDNCQSLITAVEQINLTMPHVNNPYHTYAEDRNRLLPDQILSIQKLQQQFCSSPLLTLTNRIIRITKTIPSQLIRIHSEQEQNDMGTHMILDATETHDTHNIHVPWIINNNINELLNMNNIIDDLMTQINDNSNPKLLLISLKQLISLNNVAAQDFQILLSDIFQSIVSRSNLYYKQGKLPLRQYTDHVQQDNFLAAFPTWLLSNLINNDLQEIKDHYLLRCSTVNLQRVTVAELEIMAYIAQELSGDPFIKLCAMNGIIATYGVHRNGSNEQEVAEQLQARFYLHGHFNVMTFVTIIIPGFEVNPDAIFFHHDAQDIP
eukprot:gene24809-32306_t